MVEEKCCHGTNLMSNSCQMWQTNYHPEPLLENEAACFKIQCSLHIIHPQDQCINRFLKTQATVTLSMEPYHHTALDTVSKVWLFQRQLSISSLSREDVMFEIFQTHRLSYIISTSVRLRELFTLKSIIHLNSATNELKKHLIPPVASSSSSFRTLLSSSSSSSPSFAFLSPSFTGTTVKFVGIFTPCASSQCLLFVLLLSLPPFSSLSLPPSRVCCSSLSLCLRPTAVTASQSLVFLSRFSLLRYFLLSCERWV